MATNIKAITIALYQLNNKHKAALEEYKYQKEYYEGLIRKWLNKKEKDSFSFDSSNINYSAKFITQKRINFDVDKLQEKLDKEIFDEICTKSYRIIDYEGMVAYLKSLGAKPKDFKKFIFCDKEINKDRLNQLSELGDITADDIDGCFTVTENSGYVKVSIKEKEDEED